MNKKKKLAVAVLASLASLALLGGMLAQFTDSDSSPAQVLTAGTIDVTIEEGADWDHNLNLLAVGDTAVRNFSLHNAGSLAMDSLLLTVDVTSGSGELGGNLAEAVTATVKQGSTVVVPAAPLSTLEAPFPLTLPTALLPGESVPFTVAYEVVGAPAAQAGNRARGERTSPSNPDNKYQGAAATVTYSILATQLLGGTHDGEPGQGGGDGDTGGGSDWVEPETYYSEEVLGVMEVGTPVVPKYSYPGSPALYVASTEDPFVDRVTSFVLTGEDSFSTHSVDVPTFEGYVVGYGISPTFTWTTDGNLLMTREQRALVEGTWTNINHLDLYSLSGAGEFTHLDSAVLKGSYPVYSPWRNEIVQSTVFTSNAPTEVEVFSTAGGTLTKQPSMVVSNINTHTSASMVSWTLAYAAGPEGYIIRPAVWWGDGKPADLLVSGGGALTPRSGSLGSFEFGWPHNSVSRELDSPNSLFLSGGQEIFLDGDGAFVAPPAVPATVSFPTGSGLTAMGAEGQHYRIDGDWHSVFGYAGPTAPVATLEEFWALGTVYNSYFGSLEDLRSAILSGYETEAEFIDVAREAGLFSTAYLAFSENGVAKLAGKLEGSGYVQIIDVIDGVYYTYHPEISGGPFVVKKWTPKP